MTTSKPARASSRQMARPIRLPPPVTRAAPFRAAGSVNPAELDEVDRGENGDEAEDDVEGQHAMLLVAPAIKRAGRLFKQASGPIVPAMTTWRTRIEPFTRPLFFAHARTSRGMTLGVRGIAVAADGCVLLVKHTYLHGWWLPGGGVERGQNCEGALIREMHEEAGIIVEGRPALISVHANERFFRGDHVLVYRIDRFTVTDRTSHGEIAEIGWFDPEDLPEDTHRATRDRLGEVLGGREVSGDW